MSTISEAAKKAADHIYEESRSAIINIFGVEPKNDGSNTRRLISEVIQSAIDEATADERDSLRAEVATLKLEYEALCDNLRKTIGIQRDETVRIDRELSAEITTLKEQLAAFTADLHRKIDANMSLNRQKDMLISERDAALAALAVLAEISAKATQGYLAATGHRDILMEISDAARTLGQPILTEMEQARKDLDSALQTLHETAAERDALIRERDQQSQLAAERWNEIERLKQLTEILARQMLALLVMDFGYEEAPTYGHHPMRHQFAWDHCVAALGDRMQKEIRDCAKQRDEEKVLSLHEPATPVACGQHA